MKTSPSLLRYFFALSLFHVFVISLYAQSNRDSREIGITFITGRTPALEIQRDYELPQIGRRDISSDPSSLFALRLNYSKSISSKFAWDIGLEGGLNSYHFRMVLDEDFVNLSLPQTFYTEDTDYSLPYAAGILGIKYKSSLTLRSHLVFKLGIRASYYLPIITDYMIRVPLQSGQTSDVFIGQINPNQDSEIILSPDLSLDYLLDFPKSRCSLTTGFNTSFSRKYFMNGTFELNGDQQTLQGNFSKKMIFLNLGLGLIYRLNK
jgi:hypothetical protein